MSFLRPSQRFHGFQLPDASTSPDPSSHWKVSFEIRHASIHDKGSFSGIMSAIIPSINRFRDIKTLYVADIVDGIHHSFLTTQTPSVPGTRTDLRNWTLFESFDTLCSNLNSDRSEVFNTSPLLASALHNYPYIFFRIKELSFIDADHSMTQGLTIDGFYYAQYDKSNGKITAYYFDARARPGQVMRLEPVVLTNCPDINLV
ncbi:hypothetical protein P9112_010474 [Eukaryota sp. TZLM1-RC]